MLKLQKMYIGPERLDFCANRTQHCVTSFKRVRKTVALPDRKGTFDFPHFDRVMPASIAPSVGSIGRRSVLCSSGGTASQWHTAKQSGGTEHGPNVQNAPSEGVLIFSILFLRPFEDESFAFRCVIGCSNMCF